MTITEHCKRVEETEEAGHRSIRRGKIIGAMAPYQKAKDDLLRHVDGLMEACKNCALPSHDVGVSLAYFNTWLYLRGGLK